MEQVTAEELLKLQNDIAKEGIKNYTSEESEIEDSDDELIMKFVKPKIKNSQFETTAYAFALNTKMSRLRSELARTEERLRYLQLDYSNANIKIEEYKLIINNLKSRYSVITQENKKVVSSFNFTKYMLFTSVFLNGLLFVSTMNLYFSPRILYT
jgi:chromosome segregation ATPase